MVILSHSLAKVMARLPEIPDARDFELARHAAQELLGQNWTVDEVVRYLHCLEHVDPDLPEDVALARMARIRAAVKLRMEGER